MSLIIFIHFIKASHTHGHSQTDGHTASLERHCSICDYNFVKDADSGNAFFEIQDQQLYYSDYATEIDELYRISATTILLRGPPAIS